MTYLDYSAPDPKVIEAIVDACISKPLYKVLYKGEDAHSFAKELTQTNFKFDAYCPGCRREATFSRSDAAQKIPSSLAAVSAPEAPTSLNQTLKAKCTRGPHVATFIFANYGGGIAKIGQAPSLADFATADLKRFGGVLESQDLTELQQAVRLHANGVAIGAFAYLRRIFERLLLRHRDDLETAGELIEGFETLSVEERIFALKSSLPSEVVENRAIYRILSKGIHELSEAECLLIYDVMFAAITEILDRDIYEKNRKRTSGDLKAAVAALAGSVKGSSEKRKK